MIRVKVTKNIMNKVGVIFNLNIRQLIWLGAAAAVGLATFFLLNADRAKTAFQRFRTSKTKRLR